jgi:hypothetical protein
MNRLILAVCVCASAGCASKLQAKPVSHDDVDAGWVMSGKIGSRALDNDVTETTVDAQSSQELVYFDLDTGESVGQDDAWDLAFTRNYIRCNGGASGDKGVELVVIEGQSFEAVTEPPSEGFELDQSDSPEDSNNEPDNAFNRPAGSWYDYNLNTHALTPRDVTYVVHSSEGAYFKLRIEGYYDKAGTAGIVRFLWAKLVR